VASTGARSRIIHDRRLGQAGHGWILLDIGRVDDVIKVSGYRLGPPSRERLVSHPAVAEAAAIGLPHDVKGQLSMPTVS